MKKGCNKIILFVVLEAFLVLTTAFIQKSSFVKAHHPQLLNDDLLKQEAFEILDTKCNVCHRKRNPFMVFSLKNIEKRAPKIYKQVFVERRMPKGDDNRLNNEEYNKLEKWLSTQKIY